MFHPAWLRDEIIVVDTKRVIVIWMAIQAVRSSSEGWFQDEHLELKYLGSDSPLPEVDNEVPHPLEHKTT